MTTEHYSWKRLFWYYTGYYDEYPTDTPSEDDVNKKQVLCKQVNLSKLKLNKVNIEPSVPFDLQKIKPNDKKVPLPLCDNDMTERQKRKLLNNTIPKPPPSSPINISQKQKNHQYTYADKLLLLKNL